MPLTWHAGHALAVVVACALAHLILRRFCWYRRKLRPALSWWRYWTTDPLEQRYETEFAADKRKSQSVLTGIACFFLGMAFCAWLVASQTGDTSVELGTKRQAAYQTGR